MFVMVKGCDCLWRQKQQWSKTCCRLQGLAFGLYEKGGVESVRTTQYGSGMAVSARGRMRNTPQRKQAQASSSTDLYPLTSLLRLRWAIPAVSCCAAWHKVVRKKRDLLPFGAWATPQHHEYIYILYIYYDKMLFYYINGQTHTSGTLTIQHMHTRFVAYQCP